jgi:hypothetical protein
MAWLSPPERARRAWTLARAQHWTIATFQLLALGFTRRSIEHRVATGRLHRIFRGVYAVGRRDLTRRGMWMGAVLACRLEVVLSHGSAAALWGIHAEVGTTIHVVGLRAQDHRHPGLVAHRSRTLRGQGRTHQDNIPVTTPLRTLLDLGTCLPAHALEAAINEADKLDLIEFSELRVAMDEWRGQRGVRPLREILDRGEFVLTDSELERRFLPIAKRAGLGTPLTQHRVNGFRVDFYWPDLGLVVETDGLRYHRTPSAQRKDRLRDQTHIAAGLIPLRFTHWQVRHDRQHVERTLRVTASRCRASAFSRDWGS